MPDQHIVVAGAGAIGCFVGGLLAAGGRRVSFLARARVIGELRDHGLTLTDYAGLTAPIAAADLTLTDDPACLTGADLVLVTVKSGATADMAALIAQYAPATASVVSLQNGVGNADILRAALPGRDVRAGMVPFNVVPMGQGRFHRATSGDIAIGAGPGGLASLLSVPHLPVTGTPGILALQWGKLLLNLNNALNALSALTLQKMLLDRRWRRLMAQQMAEALSVLRAAGIRPGSAMPPLPSWAGPHVLRLPTPLFRRVAARALTVDPMARSSMAHDLMQGRPTEIDSLQGEILRLAQTHGRPAPICARIADAIRAAETAGQGLPGLDPDDLSGRGRSA